MEKKNKISWIDDARKITSILIVLMIAIIILSQSFAINNNLSTIDILKNIVNHNVVYLLLLIYFVSIKTYFGKKNFNYFNLILIAIYMITSITSLLNLFQSLSLSSIISFVLNITLLIYISHVFLRNTRLWKELNLSKSPFNELSNDWLLSAAIVLTVTKLAVTLIFTTSIDGAFLSFLDCIFGCFFVRYIYLYRDYLDMKKKDINNKGNFDELRADIKDTIDSIKNKTDLDEKFVELKDKATDYIKEKKIDEKIDSVKDKIGDTVDDIKEKTNEFIKDNKIDEKIEKVKDNISDTIEDIKDNKTKKKRTTKKKEVEK